MLVEWDKKQNHKLSLETVLISSYNYYDIKSITFLVDDKAFSYKPTGLTQQKSINQLIPRHSLNSFILPRSFLEEINEAKNIEISIETDSDGDLNVTIKTGKDKYKLFYAHLSKDVTYTSIQTDSVKENPYGYKITFFPAKETIEHGLINVEDTNK